MQREKFGSRLGFILVSAGCAIGIGNVWKFPYVTGANGGGFFVLFYLLFLVIMGLPVLTMELAVGRASRKSAVLGYKALEKEGSKWHIHGWFAIAGCYLLMMYYTTVSGWMLSYFIKFLTGTFEAPGLDTSAVFGGMLANPKNEMGIFMAITVILGFFVCSFKLQSGLERITKWMMLGLLALILILVVHSMTLENALEGLKFYLMPNKANVQQVGIGKVITAAMNQSFFTLSLGVAAMEIFGSYMSKEKTLATEAAWICGLDTFVAICSGLIIFPACFAFGVQPDAGPSLIFQTLPRVFISMQGGRIWGTLFFLFMTFASFSTVIAVFENIITTSTDNFGWSRKKACFINIPLMILLSLPCALGPNLLSGFQPLGPGSQVLDLEDFIVSNLLLPLGSLVFLLFCVLKAGWGWDNFSHEANQGEGMKVKSWMRPYMTYVLPFIIGIVFIMNLF